MDNSKEAIQARLEEWTAKIKEREESGMSIPDFCEVYDISISKYNYWARRIKQAASDEIPNEIVDVTELVKKEDAPRNVIAVAKSKPYYTKNLNVLCLKITVDTSEKLICDAIKAFINA